MHVEICIFFNKFKWCGGRRVGLHIKPSGIKLIGIVIAGQMAECHF